MKVARVLERLRDLGVTDLITIGGDDTVLGARFLVEAAAGGLRCVHVPKTIDNDLPLPHGVETFGFMTARFWGTQIVKNLMQDSLTTGRWYFVTAMGRSAGWLALAVGQSASATLTLIPEEFEGKTTLSRIADVIEGAMIKRASMGRPDGVAVFAEGLAFRLGDRDELARLLGRDLPVDASGHVRLAEIPLGDMLRKEIRQRFVARREKITIVSHELGYELRSADPTPADMSYCRSLGHGAVQLLLRQGDQPEDGVMVTLESGNLAPMKFQQMVDPETNRTRIRQVDVTSDLYRVSRAYMIRLERSDIEDPDSLKRLADVAQMSPEDFAIRFRPVTTTPIIGEVAE
jgi:6-phosphofructokinase 1